MATGVFGLNKVYRKQYENIKEKNLSYLTESNIHGYVGGGSSPTLISSIERIEFSNDTISSPGKSLDNALERTAATSSAFYGYFAGGFTPGGPTGTGERFCNINRLDFSNEVVSQPGKNLPNQHSFFTGLSGPNYGYYAGGRTNYFAVYNPWGPFSYWNENFTSAINRLDFTSETFSTVARSLPSNYILMASLSNELYGYFGGGELVGVANVSSIARFDFSNDLISYPGKALPGARADFTATQSAAYGYFMGGQSLSTITRLDFSNEVVSNPGSNLPESRWAGASVENSSYGYLMAGYNGSVVNTVTRLDFASETTSNPGKNLSGLRHLHSAVTGGASVLKPHRSSAYFAGGFTGSYISSIVKLSFSSDTVSTSNIPLSQSTEGLSAVSSNSYGYFAGGVTATSPALVRSSSLDRIDYLNDTRITSTVPQLQRNRAAATSSNTYGYFGGGIINPNTNVSSFIRLDFSNDIISTSSSSLPTALASIDATSSNYYGYYAGGSVSTVNRLDFSNETVSQPGKNLPSARESLAATSSNSYGYFGGGVIAPSTYLNTITRLDFSNDTVSDPGKNLPSGRSTFAATSSLLYGYFSGGNLGPAFISNITRLDFSNETISDTTNLPSVNNGMCAEKNSN